MPMASSGGRGHENGRARSGVDPISRTGGSGGVCHERGSGTREAVRAPPVQGCRPGGCADGVAPGFEARRWRCCGRSTRRPIPRGCNPAGSASSTGCGRRGSIRPWIGSGFGSVLPGPWVFLTTGSAASSRRASDDCSSFFRSPARRRFQPPAPVRGLHSAVVHFTRPRRWRPPFPRRAGAGASTPRTPPPGCTPEPRSEDRGG